MPKFLYTVIFLDLITWGIWLRLLLTTKPDSSIRIAFFLVLLFIALTLGISIATYYYFHKKAPQFTNLRMIYRRGFKWALFYSGIFVSLLAMKALNVINIITLGLFVMLTASIYYQLKRSR